MKLNDDSEIYQVNNVWLGPKGNLLPWRARYSAYGVGFLVFLSFLAIEHRAGLHTSFLSLTIAVMGTLIATKYLMRVVTFERPLSTLPRMFWQDLTTPREQTKSYTLQFRTRHIL